MKDESSFKRLALNNEILFQFGPLDQGYWPDGLYTAPSDEALRYDIDITKKLGFNMIRKHVKVEPARWYYHCDKLGILVWQDMPNGGKMGLLHILSNFLKRNKVEIDQKRLEAEKRNFYDELTEMINTLHNHPSIVVWVPFNEGWGQFDTKQVVDYVKNLDSSRLVDEASGWFNHGSGDIADCHQYVGPAMPRKIEGRVAVCGEFGGMRIEIEGHIWNKKLKFGYKKFEDLEELFRFYSKLMKRLKRLKDRGLSAGVYTQTTDVEGEINGLLTYDREIIKMPKEELKEINISLYD